MTASWDFLDLKKRLIDLYGLDHTNRAIRALESINENQDFCRFHFFEIQRLRDEDLGGVQKLVQKYGKDLVLFNKARSPDRSFMIGISAHTSALLRCLHSNSDLLAHTVYFCLDAISDENINLKKVKNKLSSFKSLEANTLQNLLRNYEENIEGNDHQQRIKSDYWYLDALVNNTKHWSNILPKLTYQLKMEGKDIYQWDFEAFTYKNATYPKQDVLSFLEREYNRQSELLPKIVKEIDLLNKKLFPLI